MNNANIGCNMNASITVQHRGRTCSFLENKIKDILPQIKKIEMFIYCYVHKLSYQNTTFTHYMED